MSGDWISVEHDLPDKPKVRRIARALGIDSDSVAGKLIRVWAWFDKFSVDGFVDGAVDADVDDLARHDGFADAMASVGWLVIDSSNRRVGIPDFDDHHGNSAKKRLLKSARQRRYRKAIREATVDADEGQCVDGCVDAVASTSASTTEQNSKDKSEGETRTRVKSTTPQLPASVDKDKWAAYLEQLDHDGKNSAPRQLTAIGQLRVLAASGVDCNAVLAAAVMRGHRDLADVAQQLAVTQTQSRNIKPATSKTLGAIGTLQEEINRELAESGNRDWPAKAALSAA